MDKSYKKSTNLIIFVLNLVLLLVDKSCSMSCTGVCTSDIISLSFPHFISGKDNIVGLTAGINTIRGSRMLHDSRCCSISAINTKVEQLYNRQAHVSGKTIDEVFTQLDMETDTFIFGGAIRDLVSGKSIGEVNDIDIKFGGIEAMRKVCSRNNWPCQIKGTGKVELSSEENTVEGFSYSKSLNSELCGFESSINALLWSTKSKYIIDITGKGVSDIVARQISGTCDDPSEWIKHGDLTSLRALKPLINGFSMSDDFFDLWYKALTIQFKNMPIPTLKLSFKRFFCEKTDPTKLLKAVKDAINGFSGRMSSKAVTIMAAILTTDCPRRLTVSYTESFEDAINELHQQLQNNTNNI